VSSEDLCIPAHWSASFTQLAAAGPPRTFPCIFYIYGGGIQRQALAQCGSTTASTSQKKGLNVVNLNYGWAARVHGSP
jgi:acetyl esterase/lipase